MHSYNLEKGKSSRTLPSEHSDIRAGQLNCLYFLAWLVISCISVILFALCYWWLQPTPRILIQPLPVNLAPQELTILSSKNDTSDQVVAPDSMTPNLAKLPYCLLPSQTVGQLSLFRDVNMLRETFEGYARLSKNSTSHIDTLDLQGPFSTDDELYCKINSVSVLKGNQALLEMTNAKPIWQVAILFQYAGFKQVEVVPDLSFRELMGLMELRVGKKSGFFKEVGVSMSQKSAQGRWHPHNRGHLVNVEFWRDNKLDLKYLIKDFQERPSSGLRFSTSFPENQTNLKYNVLIFPEQNVAGSGRFEPPRAFNLSEARRMTMLSPEIASRLQAIDFRLVKAEPTDESTAGKSTGCNLCSLAAFKSKNVAQLLEEFEQYDEAPSSDLISDLYHRQGVANLQVSQGMNKTEYKRFLEGQVSTGETLHLDLLYWPRDFSRLARVHVKAWRGQDEHLGVLMNNFEEAPDSPERFSDHWLSDNYNDIRWFYDFKISY